MGPFRDGWKIDDVETVLARGDPAEMLYAPIVVSLDPPDCDWAFSVCLCLVTHTDLNVRSNALLGFAHLSRTCGRSDESIVRPLVQAALLDPLMAGRASDVADDLQMALGWHFERPLMSDELAATYEFDYSQAKPNRFASQ